MSILKTLRDNLSAQILLAMVLGVATGLLFGEKIQAINFVGDAFLRLFQMPVIPYIIVSLVSGLGRLTLSQAQSIFIKGGLVMLGFWAVILTVVMLVPLGFPNWSSASLFSEASLAETQPLDLLALFIPLNPFEAMAQGLIPSVVLFSLCLGVALIPLANKQPVLNVLQGLESGLLRITQAVAKLTPYGVFAIIATAAGTLPLEAFQRLQVYIVIQALLAVLLSLAFLPGLVALLTPLKYGDIFKALRAPLLTAFATANLVIVIPLLIERSRELLSTIQPGLNQDSDVVASPVNVLVPASFVFPDMGRLISLSFIPFAAWLEGSSIPLHHYPGLLTVGLASFFGDGLVAMRFLLKLFGMPVELVQIYITLDQVSVARFGTLLAGMNAAVLALLGTCVINGWVRWPRRALIRFSLVFVLATLLLLGSIRGFFTYAVTNNYSKDKQLASLQLLRVRNPQSAEVFTSPPPPRSPGKDDDLLEQITERGSLRVCYVPDDYPLSYFNNNNDLVGLSTEMMHNFASTLGVKLQFVPTQSKDLTNFEKIGQQLNDGYCDMIGTPVIFAPPAAQHLTYSRPLEQTFTASFIVKDQDVDAFGSWEELRRRPGLRIGLFGSAEYYQAKLQGLLPQASFVEIESMSSLLQQDDWPVDAVVWTAEAGAAWTVLYPAHSIAIPRPILSVPFAFAVRNNERGFLEVLNAWLLLKEKDGTVNSLFDYWVQGKTESVQPPRWSVLRNVLGVEW
jgi:proton glutamate symport protein